MAAPNRTSRNTSLYSLVLAYALIVLSLWKVDTGLVGRPQFTFRQGDSVVVRTTLAPTAAGDESRSEVYRLLASLLEPSDTPPSPGGGADPQNEELRRLTALALMVYAAGNGIKR
jgi:hypothetical protein